MLDAIYIILIIVLFFGGIVGYVYGSIWYEDYKEDKVYKRQQKAKKDKDEAIKKTMAERKAERDEKYRLTRERRDFIQKELKRLELEKQAVVMEEE